MPGWVRQGYEEYARRMPKECELVLTEIVPGKRGKNTDVARIVRDEGKRMLDAIPTRNHIVIMDVPGKMLTTKELSETLKRWLESGQNIAILIGGPEGLSDSVRNVARETWSLSSLTFPHPLVRIIVAEQLYRAWSILKKHPYHRE